MTVDRSLSVPLCDIQAQYRGLQESIESAVTRVMRSGQAILGPEVAAFEKEAAEYCGASHAVGCASGTDAILLALAALGIGPGDEVILPPFTFFATVGSVVRVGATPVFVDIEPETFNIDTAKIEAKITPKTRAIMPVHLYGQCADMGPIQTLAKKHNLFVVEDAAQSYGSEYRGVRCGSLGIVNCFSFYPTKNLGTLGDAGMVTTNDPEVAKKLVALRNHGCEVRYYHKYLGWNARLDAMQAAILRVKIPHVENWIAQRQVAAKRYDRLIEEFGLATFLERPVVRDYGRHTFNQYVVRVGEGRRDELVKFLKSDGVSCEVYYPLCLHQQECLAHLGHHAGDFPVSEAAARSVLALPIYPEITEMLQRRVIDACARFVAGEQVRSAA